MAIALKMTTNNSEMDETKLKAITKLSEFQLKGYPMPRSPQEMSLEELEYELVRAQAWSMEVQLERLIQELFKLHSIITGAPVDQDLEQVIRQLAHAYCVRGLVSPDPLKELAAQLAS